MPIHLAFHSAIGQIKKENGDPLQCALYCGIKLIEHT